MTTDEERQYLCELIMSASEWRLSEGDERDTIRLEIQDRLRRLNGVETEDENGYVQSEPVEVSPVLTQDDYKALEAAKLNKALEAIKLKPAKPARGMNAAQRYRATHVRVKENGKSTWHRKDECRQVPVDGNPSKFRWVWDGQSKPVDKLSDELWAEHESGNA